ncbi:hypothetical protein K457DRAFT_36566 [Linnemannia elongata AG-77]|uniref:Uncharacterized protein n=1 Tax=Linnemannia elongata AG-77 TaxID=1314771 RepID=A0A197JFV4_9FUNG|nr:hypothetical protein K457DRAFT_36566 [Linnemannia elongata AG-77]
MRQTLGDWRARWDVASMGSQIGRQQLVGSILVLWSLGRNELSLADANLSGAVGLLPVDIKLVKQRGAITESEIQS